MAKTNTNYSILVGVELDTSDIKKQLKDSTKNMKINLDSKDLDTTAEKAKKVKDNVKDMTQAVYDAQLTFQAANEVFQTSIDIITSMVDEVFELDGALTEFQKVSNLSGEALDEYVEKLTDMGASVARTGSEMVASATEFRKNGFNDEDAAQLGRIAEIFRNISDEEISSGESASFIIAQMVAFRDELERFATEGERAEHIINAVDTKLAA